jgi:hypothetical protein
MLKLVFSLFTIILTLIVTILAEKQYCDIHGCPDFEAVQIVKFIDSKPVIVILRDRKET